MEVPSLPRPPLSALVSAVGNRKPYAVHRLGWLADGGHKLLVCGL